MKQKFKAIYSVNDEQLLELINLDGSAYNGIDAGEFNKCKEWLSVNNEIYTVLLLNNKPIAYINFMPITDSCYNKLKKGEIKDYQITKNDVLKFSKLKPNKCLFTSIVVDKSYQNGIVLLKLMQAFKEGMINKQIQVSHIIMDCVSDIGNKCANYIKAKLICKTNDSNIYELIVNKSR